MGHPGRERLVDGDRLIACQPAWPLVVALGPLQVRVRSTLLGSLLRVGPAEQNQAHKQNNPNPVARSDHQFTLPRNVPTSTGWRLSADCFNSRATICCRSLFGHSSRPSPNESTNDSGKEHLRVLEARVLDLVVEVAPLVVADEVGADVLVAGTLGRLGLMLETTEKGLCNILFEVDARVLIDDLLSQIFRKVLITDTQHIESDAVVQKLHLQWFV